MTQCIHNEENAQRTWGHLIAEMRNGSDKEVVSTTMGQAPSFSGFLLFSKETFGECTHQMKINFSVSLLGDFYNIYGVDETIISRDAARKFSAVINVVTPSPFKEFKEPFDYIEDKLRATFPTHKIIPYAVGQQYIQGLQVHYLDDEDCSINQALFNHYLEKKPFPIWGNENYGMDQWQLDDTKGGGWIVGPPLS